MIDLPAINAKVDRVVMFHSLPSEDHGVFRRTHEHLDDLTGQLSNVELVDRSIDSKSHLQAALQDLAVETKNSGTPLIHLDMHGSKENGLQLVNGEFMCWEETAELLGIINNLTQNHMMVVSTVCFSLDIINPPKLSEPSPFCLLVAPVDKLLNGSIEDNLFSFYSNWFRECDTVMAINSIDPDFYPFIPERQLFKVLRNIYCGCEDESLGISREQVLASVHREVTKIESVSLEHVRDSIIEFWQNIDSDQLNDLIGTYMCGRPPYFSVEDLSCQH